MLPGVLDPDRSATRLRGGRAWCILAILSALVSSPLQAASPELLQNGGFEENLTGWNPLWTREPNTGRLELDRQVLRTGQAAVRLEHRGQQDWSLNSATRLPAEPGDILELAGWVKTQGSGRASLCVTTYDEGGKTLDWSFGESSVEGPHDWRRLHSRFVIPKNVTRIQPRLVGSGPITVWLDDVSLRRTGNVAERRRALPAALTLSNQTLSVVFDTVTATFSVRDLRAGQAWTQQAVAEVQVLDARPVEAGRGLEADLLWMPGGLEVRAIVRLEEGAPEFTVSLSATGRLGAPLRYPHPFSSEPGTSLVVPMNEGISYPVEDTTIEPMRLIAYGGHGICMAFWGVTDGERGQMAILETADDAAIRLERRDGRLRIAPEWDAQKGQFGYARKLRYVFLDRGGHVAMAKRYRAYAQQTGRFKTLAEKRARNPQVDLLIGAVNVWCWDRDAVALVRELQAAGIDRILWSNRQSPDNLRALNELGVLTSRYDIYQDVMNPEHFPVLRGIHPDWTTEAWPNDLMLGANGDWTRGWRVRGKDEQWYPCGVLCDKQAPAYAARRIPAELQTHPYRSRFIDTTTASPWRECYHPGHPMTRTESREWKMELLRYVSEEHRLVTGCETGHDAAVPYLHYFEGMLSLGPYRVPDSGRDMRRIWDEVPERVARFQVGHAYRLPLWELVYHDCVVAQWYWGDYNNKLPALWDKRDLFNLLYGTPPMFMFDRALWAKDQTRFVQSYRTTGPVARATGYSEMTDHRFLTPDRAVQETRFANGVRVVVNFGETPRRLPDGTEVGALGFRVEGVRE